MDPERPTVTVDGVPVRLWPWSHWQDAILAHDAAAGRSLALGQAWIEDALGQPLDPGGAVVDGAEIRLARPPALS